MNTVGNNGTSVMFTPEGGVAVWIINKTGAPSWKGAVVETHATVADAADLIGVGDPDPMGIVYDDGVADGELMRIVISGKAEVFFIGSVSLHQFARVTNSGDVGNAPGKAIAEAVPVSPFAIDKHFLEVGHVLESRVGAGLALTLIHFN
jgi:hypothetical protein